MLVGAHSAPTIGVGFGSLLPPASSGDSTDVVAQAQESAGVFLATEVRSAVLHSKLLNILKCPKGALTEDSCREMDEIMSASPHSVPRFLLRRRKRLRAGTKKQMSPFILGCFTLGSLQSECFGKAVCRFFLNRTPVSVLFWCGFTPDLDVFCVCVLKASLCPSSSTPHSSPSCCLWRADQYGPCQWSPLPSGF